MRKKVPLILALISVTGLLTIYFLNAYELFSKSYYVDEVKLYRVDTFHLYTRAFRSSDGGGGKFSSSEPQLVFESNNRYSFAIDKNIFQAITDRQKLEDTLMYHDLKFTVFSVKENYDKYRESKKPIFIRVYQLQIGDTKFIDIPKMNEISKGKLMRGILLPPAFIFFMLILPYRDRDMDWTNWKIAIWCITFFLTMIGLLLLT